MEIGQVYEINYPSEGVDLLFRFRIVNINDDGKTVWVRRADIVGNSFPVARSELRSVPAVREGRS